MPSYQEEGSGSDLAEAGSASADSGRGSIAWSQPYFAALAKYLRASRGGMPRLQAHLLQARPSTAGRSTCAWQRVCLLSRHDGCSCPAEELASGPKLPMLGPALPGAPSFPMKHELHMQHRCTR